MRVTSILLLLLCAACGRDPVGPQVCGTVEQRVVLRATPAALAAGYPDSTIILIKQEVCR